MSYLTKQQELENKSHPPVSVKQRQSRDKQKKNGKFVANTLGKTKQNILITGCSMITMRDSLTRKKYQLCSTFTTSLTFLNFQNYPKHSLTYQTNPNFRRNSISSLPNKKSLSLMAIHWNSLNTSGNSSLPYST